MSSEEVLKIMHSHGYPIKTPEERQTALDRLQKDSKNEQKKGTRSPKRERAILVCCY